MLEDVVDKRLNRSVFGPGEESSAVAELNSIIDGSRAWNVVFVL